MGIKLATWHEYLVHQLAARGIVAWPELSGDFLFLKFHDTDRLLVNLIDLDNQLMSNSLSDLSAAYRAEGIQLIQLWEDIWQNRSRQVIGRICSILGKNKTLHGRKTKVIAVNQPEADRFFMENHLQSSASARYKYALTLNEEIVAVASFSAKRNMTRKAPGYTSVELIRFASLEGVNVQGGLSKLIQHLIRTVSPNDIMTYTDNDWSDGKGYAVLGFELVDQSDPVLLWLNRTDQQRFFTHRLPDPLQLALESLPPAEGIKHLDKMNYTRVFNTGNLKYILYL